MTQDEKIKIRFEKEFTHPDRKIGNVWYGREMTLSPKQALRFIELGQAKQIIAASEGGNQIITSAAQNNPAPQQIIKKATKEKNHDSNRPNRFTGRSKKSSKNKR